MGCENTHLLDTAEYRIQVCSDKHCNGSPAKQNEFAAFWKLLCNITGVPEMEKLYVWSIQKPFHVGTVTAEVDLVV